MIEKLLFGLIALLIPAATAYRLFPIVLGQPWLSEFFITEDGYLMLTVARNLGIGLGMSVSDGTIPTNGVQPLATLVFAIPYYVTGGDKLAGLIGVIAISAAISLAGLFAVHSFSRKVLESQDANPLWPWLAAVLWFTGPLLLLHTMNALETGLYTLSVVCTLIWFGRVLELSKGANAWHRLSLGALCGITFLARNDGAFLVTTIFLAWATYELFVIRHGFGKTIARLLLPGCVCILISSPWLISNKLNFGSFIPVSGLAEALRSSFGQNAALIPINLLEHLFPMLPIPAFIERVWIANLLAAVFVILVLAIFIKGVLTRGGTIRFVIASYIVYGVMLCVYYGLFFGAPHFMNRYLAPLAPLLIVAAVSVLITVMRMFVPRISNSLVSLAGVLALVLSVSLLFRLLLPGAHTHEHFQVVRWVNENVPDDIWVGAVQSGTLGYWHDRTINLDGKVNPEALRSRQTDGHVLNYVVASRIKYIVDWVGIAEWHERTEANFSNVFELLIEDHEANLAVLRRRTQ